MPRRHLLHAKELPRPEGCVFCATGPADEVAIVGLLASHGGASEAVSAAEATGEKVGDWVDEQKERVSDKVDEMQAEAEVKKAEAHRDEVKAKAEKMAAEAA